MKNDDSGDLIFEVDFATCPPPGPIHPASRKKAEEYLAILKEDRPEEYAKIMKQREEAAKKKNLPGNES